MNTKEIENKIKALGRTEVKAKELLTETADLVLGHSTHHNDPSLINKLVSACQTANKRMIIAFYKQFGIFQFNAELKQFSKKKSGEALETALVQQTKFLEEYHGDIFLWYNAEIKLEKVARPELTLIMERISKGIAKGKLDKKELVKAIVGHDDLLDEIVVLLETTR